MSGKEHAPVVLHKQRYIITGALVLVPLLVTWLVLEFLTKPRGTQRVVLIEFPSPGLRTIGFVTRVMVDEDSGEEFAVVYVPTSPNPTSGYMEIVPLADVIETLWSMDEGLRFVMTAGTSGPDVVRLRRQPGR